MKLYHGSPKNLKIIKPQRARGYHEFENQKAIFLTDSLTQAALYALGKTLKGKTSFALPPNKLLIIGNEKPKEGYVYSVNIDAKKGIWDQYSYNRPIKTFKKIKIRASEYKENIAYVKTNDKLMEICINEKKKWLEKNGYCIPKIKFGVSNVNNYLPTILRFLIPKKGEWNWKEKILNEYPNLKIKLKKINNISEKEKVIKNFFEKKYREKKPNLKIKKREFEKKWDKISDEFFLALSEVIGINFPKKMKILKANVTLNPICPRYLQEYSFDLYHKFKFNQMVAVSMHEICHFIYFEKYREVFKKIKPKCGNILNLHLSEIVPSIILNEKKFQKIMKYNHKTYKEYSNVKIQRKNLVLHIKNIFNKRKNFEDFLIKADMFIHKHQKVIKKGLKD